MTSTSGSEVGQVFVRISAVGDAVKVLRELQTEFRRTMALTNQFDNMQEVGGDINPVISQVQALQGAVERLSRQSDSLNRTFLESQGAIQRAFQKTTQAAQQQQSVNAGAIASAQQIAMVNSKAAAAAGDFRAAIEFARQAVDEAKGSQIGMAAATKNYVEVMTQAVSGNSALGRSFLANANSALKLEAQTTQSVQGMIAQFNSLVSSVSSVRTRINELGGDFDALAAGSKSTKRMHDELALTLQKQAVALIGIAEKTMTAKDAAEAANTIFQQVNSTLKEQGYAATLVEQRLQALTAAQKKASEANAQRLERTRMSDARRTIEDARFTFSQGNELQALQQLNIAYRASAQYGRARAKIFYEMSNMSQRVADSLTKQALAEARGAMSARNYAEAHRIATQRVEELSRAVRLQQEFSAKGVTTGNILGLGSAGGIDPRAFAGSQQAIEQLRALQTQAEQMARSPRAMWWDSAVGQLRSLSGTVLALTGAFYTLRDAAMGMYQVMQQGAQFSVVQNQLKLLSESTDQYNQSLQVAKNNIALFGGSLMQTMQDMNRTIILSNQTGASVKELNDALILLATKDPQQGTEGAMIALNEALAEGNVQSLRRRFEMATGSLSMFTDESLTSTEQIKLFQVELAKMGVSMELLDGSVSRGSKAVNTFGASSEEVMYNLGQLLNNLLTGQMERLTAQLDQVNERLMVVNKQIEDGQRLAANSQGLTLFGEGLSRGSMPFNPFIEPVIMGAYYQAIKLVADGLGVINPAAKKAAEGIAELNDEMTVAEKNALKNANAISEYIQKLITQTALQERQSVAYERLLDISWMLNQGQIDLATAMQMVSDEFDVTTNNSEDFALALNKLAEEAIKNREALLSSAEAAKVQANALAEYIMKTVESTNEEARNTAAKEKLNQIALNLHDGVIDVATAAGQLYTAFGLTREQSVEVAKALGVLGAAAAATQQQLVDTANAAAVAFQQSMASILQARALIGKTGVEAAAIEVKQAQDVLRRFQGIPETALDNQQRLDRAEAINRLQQAQVRLQQEQVDLTNDWAIETGQVQRRIDALLPQYQRLVDLGEGASVAQKQQRLDLARQISLLQSKLPKAEKGGGAAGGGAARLSDQDKLNNQLALDQLKADQQAEDALIAHEQRMLEIRQDYAERTLRAIEEYQEDQKAGRASFYESLTGIEDHGLQKAMSAQFEAAALEAGKIAQTLGPDVAAQFLQQMQKNITDQAKRQQEISKALDKNSDTFNPSLAEYLRGVDQLFRVSEQGAINKILRARDSLAMSEQGAVQEAEQKYIEALAKISDNAAESAERRIEAVRLAGKEIDLEIAKVQELGVMYEKIGFMPGSQRTVALQGNAPDPMAGVSESLSGIAADITSVLNAIRSNTGDTASAVRRLSPSVTQ